MDHVSVLLHESIEALSIQSGDTVVDATLGDGGHTLEIWKRFGTRVRIIGIDRDPVMLERARRRLAREGCSITCLSGNFRDIETLLRGAGVRTAARILFDLGVSSPQLEGSKGLSFSRSGFLDMRLSPNDTLTAYEIVNRWRESRIARCLREYGDERYAAPIAEAIVAVRGVRPIERTDELARIVEDAVPQRYRRGRIHAATRTFQALRIAVNDELESLRKGLEGAWNILSFGGALVVISFHSLEDRIVKRFLKEASARGEGILGTKKPIRPTDEEIDQNPRSRSAKLRAIKKFNTNDPTQT